MPSVSKRQQRLMDAVAHGWKPDKIKGPPVKVAKKYVAADKAVGPRKLPETRAKPKAEY